MQQIILTILLFVTVTGCGPRYVDFFPCDDEGRTKPAVAILPVLDSSNACWSWSASEIINQTLYTQAMARGELYLLSQKEMGRVVEMDFTSVDPALGQHYPSADFVVFIELLEDGYAEIKGNSPGAIAICMPYETLLKIKARIKLVDLRPRSPRVVLQEIFAREYLMPHPNCEPDLENSPTKRAHQQMAASLNRRLEQVIESAY